MRSPSHSLLLGSLPLKHAAEGALTTSSCVSNATLAGCTLASPAVLDGAAGVAIDARNAYVAGLTSDSITVFRRKANGSLTQIGCVDIGGTSCVTAAPASLDGAFDVAMDARNVYVVSTVFGSVTTFARAADGSLTQTQCISRAPISGCTTSGSLDSATAVTIDDTNVYVASYLDR